MSADAVDMAAFTGNSQVPSPQEEVTETWPVVQPSEQSNAATNGEPELAPLPATPTKKPLPKAPAVTPRLKKKIPWKGKNIMILLPRDDERGRPGQAPRPLREHEIKRMFASWDELGYRTDGFDLLVEGYQPQGTDDSQTRDAWPNFDDVVHERHKEPYKVILPDLNSWKNYVDELQEAKLRALGVTLAADDPEPAPSVSPPTDLSRQPSVQYTPMPFSPPIPTSSASSNHAHPAFPFPGLAGHEGIHSPGLMSGASPGPFGAPGKFNPRQSISLPMSGSPSMFSQQWQGMGMNGNESPFNLNGVLSPQSPFGIEGFPTAGSPALNMHQRHQSMQYPMMPHQQLQQQAPARASPRLQDVREDEEEENAKSPSKTPEPTKQNSDTLQAEIDEAEYHLEESLRNQLEHEDYNPLQARAERNESLAAAHDRHASGNFDVSEHFASEPGKPLQLHHPRPHSRGHSLTQGLYDGTERSTDATPKKFAPMQEIAESQKGNEAFEIETNPSNLGTPVQELNFSTPFGQHKKTDSAASNPWSQNGSATESSAKRMSHGSKSSFSKLNVKAPEFKFNPASSFTPGVFSFSQQNFQPSQPSVFNAATPPANPSPQPTKPLRFHASAPSFAPSKSDFNFSTLGPSFRVDAPAFVPTQSLSKSVTSAAGSGSEKGDSNKNSIFGNIDIDTEIVRPTKKSSAVPIIRPSSRHSAKSIKLVPEESDEERGEGREDNRAKRARSAMPDGDDEAVFAEPQHDETQQIAEKEEAEIEAEADATLPVDTSMSSAVTSEQFETKETTAAPSETSPVLPVNKNTPFEFDSTFDAQNFDQSRPFGEEKFPETTHQPSLSASAQPFVPSFANQESFEAPAAEPVAKAQEPLISISPKPEDVPSKGLGQSRFAPKPKGLAASRFAAAEPEPPVNELIDEPVSEEPMQLPMLPELMAEQPLPSVEALGEPTFEEIDAVMQHMEAELYVGNSQKIEPSKIQPPLEAPRDVSPLEEGEIREELESLEGGEVLEDMLPDVGSPTPRQQLPEESPAVPSAELEDPFVDPPITPRSPELVDDLGEPQLQNVVSDWEAAFTEDEQDKLHNRAQFFDGHVNEVVGNLLASRLEPLEKSLFSIQEALLNTSRRAPSTRRDVRSMSAELQESDADDEDDEPALRRSLSPRKGDRRLDQIRSAVFEALAAQERSQPLPVVAPVEVDAEAESAVLKALEEIRSQFDTVKVDFKGDDFRTVVEEIVQSRMPPTPEPDTETGAKMDELHVKVLDLEQRLGAEQSKVEQEIAERRAADNASAELNRQLQAAETRVEIEIINRSVFDQRVADLEEKLRHQEGQAEEEVKTRRLAEDRLSEVQRLLRISSEEENRLREVVEEREHKLKALEQAGGKNSMRMTLLEHAQNNATQSQSEMTNKINALEVDLKNVRQDNYHWRAEAEQSDQLARRNAGELAHAVQETKHLQKSLDTMTTQLEENERLRESWRGKTLSLQEDMGRAAREIAQENAHRIKKEQAMLARQEVLDARLQAEAKTRERLEVEMDRLQTDERKGMRAGKECERLESLLGEMRTENHKLSQAAMRYQREFEEARDSGASEVKRTRMTMQSELDAANNQVNVVREELEEQNNKLRAELDSVKMEVDTAKVQNEMLLEEAENSKASALEELQTKKQNELEDVQARLERLLNNAVEDGQKAEQNLLERLSLSSSKIEHLQDRIVHLEEKLEIAKEAAAAAAAAAKSAGVESGSAVAAATVAATKKSTHQSLDAPEKISPQALRESIMVLQEQLQAREQRIEELEQTVSKLDPEAPTKISKRDDEISWLRELLAVRHSDLQDVITALSGDNYSRERVKDAAIRLKANLQMEQQERERAMNGGSAINLPNIASSLQNATPRVAQSIGAAWGSWRKGSTSSFRNISGVLNSPGATPSKSSPQPTNSALSGLLTPPASGMRQYPIDHRPRRQPPVDNKPQPTAFASTGRRFPSNGSASSRARRDSAMASQAVEPPLREAIPPAPEQSQASEAPSTPPMMGSTGYDSDAQPGTFDDDDFFEDDE